MIEKVLSLTLVAALALGSFQALGGQLANNVTGASQGSSTTLRTGAYGRNLPSLVSRAEAGIAAALKDVTRLAKRAANGSKVSVSKEISLLASRMASASILDEVAKYAAELPDDAWKPRLIHGLDPDTPWRDLDIVSIDLEGKIGEPTQIGLIKISGREIGNEVTLRITPASGESTPKATRQRLLDSSKTTSTAGSFEQSRELFENFVKDRVPLAFQHQGDLQGLMHEWSRLERPGPNGIYAVEPGVEWIDVANWARVLAYGDRNSLSHVHWRVLDEALSGAHVGVNDARGAARVLYQLGEDHPNMPSTYGELVKYQIAWRKHRHDLNSLQKERLATAIDQMEAELHLAFETEKAKAINAKKKAN